jgi:hypothetical protein
MLAMATLTTVIFVMRTTMLRTVMAMQIITRIVHKVARCG